MKYSFLTDTESNSLDARVGVLVVASWAYLLAKPDRWMEQVANTRKPG